MARYELILRLDGALWLRIISKTPLTPRTAMEGQKNPKESKMPPRTGAIYIARGNPCTQTNETCHVTATRLLMFPFFVIFRDVEVHRLIA